MMDNREQWITEVLHSTDGLQKAAGNPFLYEKIQYRMQQKTKGNEVFDKKYIPRWVAIVSCILVINCVSVLHIIHKEKKLAGQEMQQPVQELSSGTNYEY